MTKENYPLEVEVQISLEDTQYSIKGEIIRFSPNYSDLDHAKFFAGHDRRNLTLFASGSEVVYYDNRIAYSILSDRAIFDQNNASVRILTYQLTE